MRDGDEDNSKDIHTEKVGPLEGDEDLVHDGGDDHIVTAVEIFILKGSLFN